MMAKSRRKLKKSRRRRLNKSRKNFGYKVYGGNISSSIRGSLIKD